MCYSMPMAEGVMWDPTRARRIRVSSIPKLLDILSRVYILKATTEIVTKGRTVFTIVISAVPLVSGLT